MKNTIFFTVILLLAVSFMGILVIALFIDCGKEARQLRATAEDTIFYSPDKPTGVSLPQEVNRFLDSLTKSFEAHDLDAVMEHFSEDFLHQGMTKQAFREHIARSYFVKHLKSMTITLMKFEPQDGIVDIAGFIETDLGVLLQSSEVLPIAERSQLRLENGHWRFFGNRENSPIGRFQDFIAMHATLVPQDLTLYRRLLPDIFDMPETPTVSVSMTENQRVALPLSPYRLGRIQLLANYHGEEGWYDLTLPETAWAPVKFGQIVGYPKYVLDSITFEQTQSGWRGEVTDKGQSLLSLEFAPDPSVETWFERLTHPSCLTLARQLLPGYAYKPTFVLMPDEHRKATVRKILVVKATVILFATPSIIETFGKVRITINQDAPWAGLFPKAAVVKGTLMKFSGDFNLKHRILNHEQENP